MLKTSFLLSVGTTLFLAAVIAILDVVGVLDWAHIGWRVAFVPLLVFLAVVGALIMREALRGDSAA